MNFGATLFVLFACCGHLFPQTFLEDRERAKRLKLLEDELQDVIELWSPGSLDIGPKGHFFYREDSVITLTYASGQCNAESESEFRSPDDWRVPDGKLVEIRLNPKSDIPLGKLPINLKTFRKERPYRNYHAYFNKVTGITVFTRGDYVDEVRISPPEDRYSQLCDNKEVRSFYASKKFRRYPEHKQNVVDFNFPADVLNLEVTPMSDRVRWFSINTKAADPERDILIYNYLVSGGRIIGVGADVIWDLAGTPAGVYTVTAAVDDGCGICGKYITKSVRVD